MSVPPLRQRLRQWGFLGTPRSLGRATAITSAAFLPHLMLGALITRPLVENRQADRPYLRRYVDAVVLPALGLVG